MEMQVIKFDHTINGNFRLTATYVEGMYSVVRVYSYGVLLFQRLYTLESDGEWRPHEANFRRTNYFSQTTRIHQGIAFSLDNRFTEYQGKCPELLLRLKKARSLADIKRITGYLPVKNYT